MGVTSRWAELQFGEMTTSGYIDGDDYTIS